MMKNEKQNINKKTTQFNSTDALMKGKSRKTRILISSISRALLSIIILIAITVGLRYLFFNLRPFVISYLEYLTGYEIEFENVTADINNNVEITNFKMYHRMEQDCNKFTIDSIKIDTKVSSVFGGTVESLISAIEKIEVRGVKADFNDNFFKSKLFTSKGKSSTSPTKQKKGLDLNKLNIIASIKDADIMYHITSQDEYAGLENLNLDIVFDSGKKLIESTGEINLSVTNLINFPELETNPGLVKEQTPMTLKLSDENGSNRFKGYIILDKAVYGRGTFNNIAMGMELDAKGLKTFTFEPEHKQDYIKSYFPNYYNTKISYNEQFPNLILDFGFSDLVLGLDIDVPQSNAPEANKSFEKLYENMFVKLIKDIVLPLGGLPPTEYVKQPYGAVNIKLDFTKDFEKDPDYIIFDVALKTDYLFHPGDDFDIYVEGNGQRILIPKLKYHSDKIGSIEGNFEIFTADGLGESYISIEDFKFLGLVYLTGEAYNDKTTGIWEEYRITSSKTQWSIPQFEDITLNLPPVKIDAFIKNEKETDLYVYVNEQDWKTFPAKVDLFFDLDSTYLPIKAEIGNLNLSQSDKLIPALIKDSSNLGNLMLNARLEGDINTLDPFSSEIKITGNLNDLKSNALKPVRLANIDTLYKDNILNINKLTAPENISAGGQIDFNLLNGDLKIKFNEDVYNLRGNIEPELNEIKNNLIITLPTKEKIHNTGTISIDGDDLNIDTKILTYSKKGAKTSSSLINALIKPEKNEDNQQRFNVEARYTTGDFYINIDGFSDLRSNSVFSHYNLQAPDLLTKADIDLNLNNLAKSYIEAVSIYRQDKLFVRVNNTFTNKILKSQIHLSENSNTLLKAEAEHRLIFDKHIGLKGLVRVNGIGDYNGDIYINDTNDLNNIYLDGIVNVFDATKLRVDGRINMRDNKFGFLGDINSNDFGNLHLLAGYVPTNGGFNVNVIGNYNNDTNFVIHSKNTSLMNNFTTNNEVIVNDEHKLVLNSNIDVFKNIISIDRLDYSYTNLKSPSLRLEEGYITASFIYSPTKYDLDLEASIMDKYFELGASLEIKNNYNTYFTDVSLIYNYKNYRLMSRTDIETNSTFKTGARLILPGDVIDISNEIRISPNSLLIKALNVETAKEATYSLTGSIIIDNATIRENLLLTINKYDNFGFQGTIDLSSLEEILINQKIKLSEYEIYNVNATAGYDDSLFVLAELTKKNAKDFYFYVNAETKNFLDYGLNIKTSKQPDSLKIIADLSLMEDGFLYTDVDFSNNDINLEGKVKLSESTITINNFNVNNRDTKLLSVDGNIYYNISQEIKDYLQKKTPKPIAGNELVAGEFQIKLNEQSSDKLTLSARVATEGDSYYSSLSTTINNSYRLSINDFYLNLSNTYSSISQGDMLINSSFSPLLEILNTSEIGEVSLGYFAIEGEIGNTPDDNGTIPLNVEVTSKDIKTKKAVEVIDGLYAKLANTSLTVSLTSNDKGYKINADMSDVVINGNYKEVTDIYASINNPSLVISITNNLNNIVLNYLGVQPFVEGTIYDNENETPFKAEGGLYLTEDILNINLGGNYGKENLSISGEVETLFNNGGVKLTSGNLKANVNKDSIIIQGETNISSNNIHLNNKVVLNELPINLNGNVIFESDYIYTPMLAISSQGINVDTQGKIMLIDSGISTDMTVNAPFADNLKINGDFVFKKGLTLNSVYLINKDLNFLLNGNVNLVNNILSTKIQADNINTRYALDGKINLNEKNIYKGNINFDIINLDTNSKSSFLLGGKISLEKKNNIGLNLNLRDTKNPLLKIKGDVSIKNDGKKYSTNSLLFTIGKDTPVRLGGYVQTTQKLMLDSQLKIDFNNDTSDFNLKSQDFKKFELSINYNKNTTNLKANSNIFLREDGAIETDSEIQMGGNKPFLVEGKIIPKKTGVSLSDFELYSTELQKNLLRLNAKLDIKEPYLYPTVIVFDSLENQYKLGGKINISDLNNPNGKLTFNYNKDIEYEIKAFEVLLNQESSDVRVNLVSNLRFPAISKNALINIKNTTIEVNMPTNQKQVLDFLKVDMKDIHTNNINIDDKTSLNMDITDVSLSASLYNKTYYIDLMLPSFLMNLINTDGKTKTETQVKLEEILLNSKFDERKGLRIQNLSTYIQGQFTSKTESSLRENIRINKNKLTYDGETIKLNIPITNNTTNDNFKLKGIVAYDLGSDALEFETFQFKAENLLISLTGKTHFNQYGIKFDNAVSINETAGQLKGLVSIGNSNDAISLGFDKLIASFGDILIETNGTANIKGAEIKNNIVLSAFDTDIYLKGNLNLVSGIYLSQNIKTLDQSIDVAGNLSIGKIIKPELNISSDDFDFNLIGGFSFKNNKFNLHNFGLKEQEKETPMFTATGSLDLSSMENVLLNANIEASGNTYVVDGNFSNDAINKSAVIGLSVDLGENDKLVLNTIVDYKDTLTLRNKTIYNNIEINSKGTLSNDSIMNIKFDVIDNKDSINSTDGIDSDYEANYSKFGTTPTNTLVWGEVSIDINNNFKSYLDLKSDLFTYDGLLAFTPNKKMPKTNYLIYTDGNFNLKNEQGGMKLKLMTAHRLSTEGYLADNVLNLTLPDNSVIETGISMKFEGLWMYFKGHSDIYSNQTQYDTRTTLFSMKYDTKFAFSEKGVYGKLTANAFNTDLTYSGLVNFDNPENIVIDGSLKSLGALFLISGDINLDKQGLVKPDLKLYKEDMDIRALGTYNYQSITHDVYLRGFYNETPYELNFGLDGQSVVDKISAKIPKSKTMLYPKLEVKTWGERLLLLESVFTMSDEMLTYNALINDIVNLAFRYNTPKNFILNVFHNPMKISSPDGSSFTFRTGDFSVSAVDGDLQTRISAGFKDFIDSKGYNTGFKINFAAYHNIKNTSFTEIAETFSKGDIKESLNLLHKFEIQNIEVAKNEIPLFKASGTANYYRTTNNIMMTLADKDNNIALSAGFDYDISQLFLDLNINGFNLIKVMDNLKYSDNLNDNRIYANFNIKGSLFDWKIYDSYFHIDRLLTEYQDTKGNTKVSAMSVKVKDIVKDEHYNNDMYIEEAKIEFDPLIESIVKPYVSIKNIRYSPQTEGSDLVSFFSNTLNGLYSIGEIKFVDSTNLVLVQNANLSFSNRLFDILGNLSSSPSIKGLYGVSGDIRKIIFSIDDFVLEVNETEFDYLDNSFKVKSTMDIYNNIGFPLTGQINISGLVIGDSGQLQLSLNDIILNGAKIIEKSDSLVFIEKNKLSFFSEKNEILGDLLFEDRGVIADLTIADSQGRNRIFLDGVIHNYTPIHNLTAFNNAQLNLNIEALLSDLSIANYIVQPIEEIEGNLDALISLNGKLFEPTISGNIFINDGFIRLGGYKEPIKKLYAHLILDNEIIEMNDKNYTMAKLNAISANHYGAEVYGTGELYYKGLFNLKALMVELTSGSIRDKSKPQPNINFKNDLVKYTGRMSIEKFRLETDFYRYNISGLVIPHSAKININPLALFEEPESEKLSNEMMISSPFPNINFDNFTVRIGNSLKLGIIGEVFDKIGDFGSVSFGDILLIEHDPKKDSSENQINLDGSINDFNKLEIRGSLSSRVGKINFLNNPFTIERAEVIFKPNDNENSYENIDSNNNFNGNDLNSDLSEHNEHNLGRINDETLATLRLKAKTYKKYIDNNTIKITLDYEGPIEKIIDDLFSSLSGDYYGSRRIGTLSGDELAVLLGLSTEAYEKFKADSLSDLTNEDGETDSAIEDAENFQTLALDSFDNLFFQKIMNDLINNIGLSDVLPLTFSVYSSGFRNIFSNIFTTESVFSSDPLGGIVSAFSERLEFLVGAGLSPLYIGNVRIYDNLYIQGGIELTDFDSEETRQMYLKIKADMDWLTGDSWLFNSTLGLSYEPFYNILDLELGLQYSYKFSDTWFLNTYANASYSQDFDNISEEFDFWDKFNLGFGFQFLFYF